MYSFVVLQLALDSTKQTPFWQTNEHLLIKALKLIGTVYPLMYMTLKRKRHAR